MGAFISSKMFKISLPLFGGLLTGKSPHTFIAVKMLALTNIIVKSLVRFYFYDLKQGLKRLHSTPILQKTPRNISISTTFVQAVNHALMADISYMNFIISADKCTSLILHSLKFTSTL
jgi:hypothetical protein